MRKKIKKKVFYKNEKNVWAYGPGEATNLKEIHAVTSEIIDATDGRRTDGRRTNFDFMSSADIVKQS